MENKILGRYRNGNVNVMIFSDGTKIRQTLDDEYRPEKPESLDYKITNRCTGTNCPFCHERSGPHGEHGDIMNDKFVETLLPYTELALGGGNVLEHPDFEKFLAKCKDLRLICNATFNQFHFVQSKNLALIKRLVKEKKLYGIGVSLTPTVEGAEQLAKILKKFPSKNVVIHVINGIHTVNMLKPLFDKGFKILILGYKMFGRGFPYFNGDPEDIQAVKNDTHSMLPELVKHFDAVSFDNLAIGQLDVRRLMSKDQWDEFYMGEEGQFTMYVDSVNKEYAMSSVSIDRHPLLDDISPMFADVREQGGFPKK
jgi:hypothetical protein